jgi:hypothetical protein
MKRQPSRAKRRDAFHTQLDDLKEEIDGWAREFEEKAGEIQNPDSLKATKLEEISEQLYNVVDGIDSAMADLSEIEF